MENYIKFLYWRRKLLTICSRFTKYVRTSYTQNSLPTVYYTNRNHNFVALAHIKVSVKSFILTRQNHKKVFSQQIRRQEKKNDHSVITFARIKEYSIRKIFTNMKYTHNNRSSLARRAVTIIENIYGGRFIIRRISKNF